MATDHFSNQARAYRQFRPTYSASFLAWVAELAPRHDLLWDVGTGSGQAAVGLAGHFRRVVASDLSLRQLAESAPHPAVHYVLATAEAGPLADHSADLVTVAQALHWFNFLGFWAEVRRVLRPGGAVVAWSYERAAISPALDPLFRTFHDDTVGRYWPPRREHVRAGYRDIPFPFVKLPAPAEALRAEWDLEHLLGYVASWSAVDRYRRATGRDPLPAFERQLAAEWGPRTAVRTVTWPLAVLAGRV